MDELREISGARQVPDEPRRRWFAAESLDLIVWVDDTGAPIGFQLCYDRLRSERALTWKPEVGFLHHAVDDGEGGGLRHKRTPVLVDDGDFDAYRVSDLFARASAKLPPQVADFVSAKLRLHSSYAPSDDQGEQP